MFVMRVVKSNKVLFQKLAPEELFEPVDLSGRFILGAVGEDERGKYAAGILIFEILEWIDDKGENRIAAFLQWLFVAEQFRRRGAADVLMQGLFGALEESGVETVVCDLSMDVSDNLLCAYLEAWGFRFTLVDKYEAKVPLNRFTDHPALKGQKTERTVSLSKVPSRMVKQSIHELKEQEGVPKKLERYLQLCDLDVSCAVMEQGRVTALTLVRRLSGRELELLVSRTISAEPNNIPEMLSFAAKMADEKYPAETLVKLVCRSKAAAERIDYFLPDLQPLLVRRGTCPLMEFGEEAQDD